MDRLNFLNFVFAITMVFSIVSSEAQLSIAFYDNTCPNAASIIRNTIQQAISREPRMAASLIRLHFHDCFVHGCDASLLLTETPSFRSEQDALANANSVRGYNVIEEAKRAVEYACPKVVSCADILTLAARDASVAVGGPSWSVRLGRRDSTTAYFNQTSDLPPPSSSAESLIKKFGNKGLNTRDMVALSGAHTLGQARCSTIRSHIYNDTDIDAGFASIRRQTCPQTGGDNNLAPFDFVTPNSFDNYYYRNLIQRKAVIHSDQVLYTSEPTRNIVTDYATHPSNFAVDFAHAMIRMGEIQPLVGQNGIIRRVCNGVN